MMLFSFIAVLGLGFAQHGVMAATASEAGNTATIEITEDWDPTLPDTSGPKPDPAPNPPKKIVTLPQTGEKKATFIASGGIVLLMGVMSIIVAKKRKSVN